MSRLDSLQKLSHDHVETILCTGKYLIRSWICPDLRLTFKQNMLASTTRKSAKTRQRVSAVAMQNQTATALYPPLESELNGFSMCCTFERNRAPVSDRGLRGANLYYLFLNQQLSTLIF